MHQNLEKRNKVRKTRVMRIRKKLRGTAEKPRLSVFKSLNHIGVQLIDDEQGVTLASYSTLAKEMKGKKLSKESAKLVGAKIAELAKGKKIDRIVFDRGRYKYHGLIAEVANGARDKGIKF
ncbi:MAG: 50S ribosomal protein L18 [Simkaniaceae bacterium]|jgi:large subunit ribosomal protein L18|nr:MAG: 50S ribosomal protein L18 [Simkaniaceae bacterium]